MARGAGGSSGDGDADGDGLSSVDDNCDDVFNPPRPVDGFSQPDVDGDGAQDILVAGYAAPAQLFVNQPSPGAWLTVKAVGAPGNPRGLGARVQLDGERLRIREIDGQHALGQGPARAHFGLGDVDNVDVTVRWPDGSQVELLGVETRQVIEVEHPDR